MKILLFLFVMLTLVATSRAQDLPGSWTREETRTVATGFVNVRYTLPALNAVEGSNGDGSWPTLVIECQDNRTAIYVDWQRQVAPGRASTRRVRYQVDFRGNRSTRWVVSSDRGMLGLWRGTGISLLRRMKGGQFLMVETRPRRRSPVYAVFELTGFDQIAADVSSHCNWRF